MATEDSALLALWEEWKVALYESLETTSEAVSRAAHARSVEIEKQICETRAEGLHGIAVQLALWHFNSEPDESDDADAAALAAYEAAVRLTGLDCLAEANAIFERPDDTELQ